MFGKIFTRLWHATLYGQPVNQLVFIYLICHADSSGTVEVVPEAIAGDTGLPLEAVTTALEFLEQPDPRSSSPEHEGRRIVRIGTGCMWHVVNYEKYRGMRDADDRRRQTRESVRRHRERVSHGKPPKAEVGSGEPRKAYAEAEAEVDRIKTFGHDDVTESDSADLSLTVDEWFEAVFWPEYPRKVAVAAAKKAMRGVFRGVTGDAEDALGAAIMAGLTRQLRAWSGKDKQYIPHAATWLNQRRWEDPDDA